MANFSITNSTAFAGIAQNNVTATYASQLAVAASSGILAPGVRSGLQRGKVYDLLLGTDAAPADTYIEFTIMRVTAASTLAWLGSLSSVSSAFMLDPADAGFAALALNNSSAETNLAIASGQPWYMGMNQRASYRWVCAPGSEIVWPAVSSGTGNNGLALKARGNYTATVTTNLWANEL